MYSFTNEKIVKLNRSIVKEIHRIIQSRLLEYFTKDHLPELIFKKILHLRYPLSALFSIVVETLIVRWEKFSAQQPSLYSDVASTFLCRETLQNKDQVDFKVLVGTFNDYRILEKSSSEKFLVFEDVSQHLVVLHVWCDRITEIFFTDSSRGNKKSSDLSGLWIRLLAWFMSMSLKS